MCGGSTAHFGRAAFSVSSSEHTDILILIRHLIPTSPHQEAQHSTPLCHPLWPGDDLPGYKAASAKSQFLMAAQFLPNPDLPSAAFQAGRNDGRNNSQSRWGLPRLIPGSEETAALAHPAEFPWLAAKNITPKTHERWSLVTQEPVTPEESWCLKKSASFTSSSAGWAEQDLSQRGVARTGC